MWQTLIFDDKNPKKRRSFLYVFTSALIFVVEFWIVVIPVIASDFIANILLFLMGMIISIPVILLGAKVRAAANKEGKDTLEFINENIAHFDN